MAAWGHTVNKVREKLSHLWRLTWDINPYYHAKENGPERIKNPEAFHSQTQLQTVAFDIAITASKSGKAGGGFGVAVIAASLKADGHRETSDSSTSRVRFEVVVDLPHQKPEQP